MPFEGIGYTVDAMSELRGDLVRLRDSFKLGDFDAIGGSMPEFGDFDHSAMLNQHHRLAHGLMMEALTAVIDTIDTFYTNLVRADTAFDNVDYMSMGAINSYLNAVENLVEASDLPGLEEARNRYRQHQDGGPGADGQGEA